MIKVMKDSNEKIERNKKNNWTQTRIENASKKINQEIYKRNRQAPIQIKLDDLSIFVNGRITRRGISKGMVFIQEDFNKNISKHIIINNNTIINLTCFLNFLVLLLFAIISLLVLTHNLSHLDNIWLNNMS